MFGSRNFLFAKASAVAAQFKLFSWGSNYQGQLGLGNTNTYGTGRSSPVQVGALVDWANTAGGNAFSLCTKTDGTLWSWGYGGSGRLGLGTGTAYSSPKQVGALTNWDKPSAGQNSNSACIKTNGTLWTWGYGYRGGTGQNSQSSLFSPVQLGSSTTWTEVAVGHNAMAAVDNGKLFSWGWNAKGQLGLGDTVNRSSPVQVGALTNWAKPSFGNNSSGDDFVICTKTDGTLWSWGFNYYGRLGLNDQIDRSSPVQIGSLTNWATPASNRSHSLCVKTDGTLWSWGRNSYGQLGTGNTANRSSPVQIGALTNWKTPGAGNNFSFCIKTDGTLWSWGQNQSYGMLGLNLASSGNNRSSPVQVGTLSGWTKIASGNKHTVATQESPTAAPVNLTVPVVTGTAKEGQTLSSTTGTWSNIPDSFAYQWQRGTSNIGGATSSTYTAVAADVGSTLRCVVTATNVIGAASANSANTGTVVAATDFLYAWGDGGQGRLGLNDTNNRSSPTQVGSLGTWTKVSSYRHTLAIKSDGTLWSWGNQGTGFGVGGQLGLGDTINRSSPVQVGALTTWANVFAAPYRSFAITTSGALFAWGYNAYGGLGLGDAAIGFPRTGTARSSPVQVGSLTGWTSIQAGLNANTTAIRAGKLYSWGNNNTGQLGLNNSTKYSSPVQVGALTNWSVVGGGGYNVLALNTSGSLFAWGQGYYGVNGQNNTVDISSPVQISGTWSSISNTGYASFAMGVKSGKLYAWGRNHNGQLGLGDTINRSSPVQVGALTTWSTVNIGNSHTAGLTTSNALWTWGRNDRGQLGQNNTNNTSSPVQVGSGTNFTVAVGGGNDILAITNS